jgi:hypothetical protein
MILHLVFRIILTICCDLFDDNVRADSMDFPFKYLLGCCLDNLGNLCTMSLLLQVQILDSLRTLNMINTIFEEGVKKLVFIKLSRLS